MLITADWVLTSAQDEPLQDGAVLVEGERIAEVGPAAELRARHPTEEVWEGSGKVLAPGFVNTHTHLYGILAHGIPLDAAPSDFWAFLNDFWWPRVEDAIDHPRLEAATAASCLELLRSGVTTFYDTLEAPNALPGALPVQRAVVERFGLRGLLSFESTERAGPVTAELGLRENIDHGDVMCFHTTFTCSGEFIRRAAELARERAMMLHMHLSESRYEGQQTELRHGMRPVHYYADLGILGPNVLASQCVHLSTAERTILAEHGVKVAHMPLSNCEVGGGIAPVPEMLDLGITAGLGSDSYIEDFFQVMRGAFMLHKARLETPMTMPARTVWHMATLGGARALGLSHTGALMPGYSADMVLIDAHLPTPLSAANIWDLLLLYRSPRHVDGVVCRGRWLLQDGELLIDVDARQVEARCREAAAELWAAV